MGESVEHGLPDPAEQLDESGVARQVSTQHDTVDEIADQSFQLWSLSSGHRRAHRQVRLAGVAHQENLECRQQHDEQRGLLASRDSLEGLQEIGREGEPFDTAGVARLGGPWVIGGKLQRLEPVQTPAPVAEQFLESRVLEAIALPARIVGELDRQRRQGRSLTRDESGIEPAQLARDDPHGPAVRHDMMHDQLQDALVLTQAQEPGPQQRSQTKVEGLRESLAQQALQLLLARNEARPVDLDHRQVDPCRGQNTLDQDTIAHLERGAKTLVPLDQLLQAALQGRHVQRSAQAHRLRRVVKTAGTKQVVEEPQGLLRVRRGGIPSVGTPRNALGLGHPLTLLPQPQREEPLPLGRQCLDRSAFTLCPVVLVTHGSRVGGARPPRRIALRSRPSEMLPPRGRARLIVRRSSRSPRWWDVETG